MTFQKYLSTLVRRHNERFCIACQQVLGLVAVLKWNTQIIECMSWYLHARSSRLLIKVYDDKE